MAKVYSRPVHGKSKEKTPSRRRSHGSIHDMRLTRNGYSVVVDGNYIGKVHGDVIINNHAGSLFGYSGSGMFYQAPTPVGSHSSLLREHQLITSRVYAPLRAYPTTTRMSLVPQIPSVHHLENSQGNCIMMNGRNNYVFFKKSSGSSTSGTTSEHASVPGSISFKFDGTHSGGDRSNHSSRASSGRDYWTAVDCGSDCDRKLPPKRCSPHDLGSEDDTEASVKTDDSFPRSRSFRIRGGGADSSAGSSSAWIGSGGASLDEGTVNLLEDSDDEESQSITATSNGGRPSAGGDGADSSSGFSRAWNGCGGSNFDDGSVYLLEDSDDEESQAIIATSTRGLPVTTLPATAPTPLILVEVTMDSDVTRFPNEYGIPFVNYGLVKFVRWKNRLGDWIDAGIPLEWNANKVCAFLSFLDDIMFAENGPCQKMLEVSTEDGFAKDRGPLSQRLKSVIVLVAAILCQRIVIPQNAVGTRATKRLKEMANPRSHCDRDIMAFERIKILALTIANWTNSKDERLEFTANDILSKNIERSMIDLKKQLKRGGIVGMGPCTTQYSHIMDRVPLHFFLALDTLLPDHVWRNLVPVEMMDLTEEEYMMVISNTRWHNVNCRLSEDDN